LALAELVVFLGHVEALGERDPSRRAAVAPIRLLYRVRHAKFRYSASSPCWERLQLKCVRTLCTAFAVAWALADAASIGADDCCGVKEAAIERAKTPHSDTHVTNVAVEAGRATDKRR